MESTSIKNFPSWQAHEVSESDGKPLFQSPGLDSAIYTVLIALDDSVFSKLALQSATAHDWPKNTRFLVCTVIEHTQFGPKSSEQITTSDERKVLEAAQTWLEEEAALLKCYFPEHDVETVLEFGSCANRICEIACERGANLIILGSHGRTGMAYHLLGSVVEQVVFNAPCSVEVIRSRKLYHPHTFEHSTATVTQCVPEINLHPRVLIVLDDMTQGRSPLPWVSAQPWTKEQELTVLTVGPPTVTELILQRKFTSGAGRSLVLCGKLNSMHLLALEQMAALQKPVNGLIRQGDLTIEVLHAIDEVDAQMVVISDRFGTSQDVNSARSVVSQIAAAAPCSIRVVQDE